MSRIQSSFKAVFSGQAKQSEYITVFAVIFIIAAAVCTTVIMKS